MVEAVDGTDPDLAVRAHMDRGDPELVRGRVLRGVSPKLPVGQHAGHASRPGSHPDAAVLAGFQRIDCISAQSVLLIVRRDRSGRRVEAVQALFGANPDRARSRTRLLARDCPDDFVGEPVVPTPVRGLAAPEPLGEPAPESADPQRPLAVDQGCQSRI